MSLDKFEKFNEGSAGIDELIKRTEKELVKELIKDVKKLKCMGSNAESQGFEDAKKYILDLLNKRIAKNPTKK
jgi:hypothetical protein